MVDANCISTKEVGDGGDGGSGGDSGDDIDGGSDKTSPQAKRHKTSLLFTSLTI